ncbi:MAG: N-acetyltransferase [Acidobacteriota bacterium]
MSTTKMAKPVDGRTGEQIEIRPVKSSRERREFLDLPYRLYRDDPHWVPPLRMAQKDMLDTRRHPFYLTADVEMFIARRQRRAVGRIMAIINHAHNSFHNERAGFFGFFESENDREVASDLIQTAKMWAKERGAAVMRGPFNPSPNYECGLLVEGFDSPPVVMMTYNPPYYIDLLEQSGLRKAVDMYAYRISPGSFILSDKLKSVADRLRESISVRTVDMKNIRREADIIRSIYNNAWSDNWGFVPMIEEEFAHLTRDLKQIVDPRIVYIAEKKTDSGEAEPVGFFLAVPDINLALKKIDGRLFPLGLIKLLWHSRRIPSFRIIIMGVIKEHQSLGVASLFYERIYRDVTKCGYEDAEMSWVLENNVTMNRAARLIGGRRYKTYRIYEMELSTTAP